MVDFVFTVTIYRFQGIFSTGGDLKSSDKGGCGESNATALNGSESIPVTNSAPSASKPDSNVKGKTEFCPCLKPIAIFYNKKTVLCQRFPTHKKEQKKASFSHTGKGGRTIITEKYSFLSRSVKGFKKDCVRYGKGNEWELQRNMV